jgi:hypothetical protein
MAAPSLFQHAQNYTAPYRFGAVVTPNDGVDLATPARALWIGGAGAVNVDFDGDAGTVLLSGVPAGTLLPIAARRVRATSTTATLIVALW